MEDNLFNDDQRTVLNFLLKAASMNHPIAANSFNHKLGLIKSWGNLKAGEFAQEWTEDDELTYRELFGESLIVLPGEVEEDTKC